MIMENGNDEHSAAPLCYAVWDDCDADERQCWIKDLICDLCDGSSQWIPSGIFDEPEFDYGVLLVVRNELSPEDRDLFGRLLHSRMSPRVEDGEAKAIGYTAGDYSACLYELAMRREWCEGLTED
jgi:hypothetical protein